jgi:hypothetical protein
MNLPPEGEQVFSWSFNEELGVGHLLSVVFLQGVDGGSPFSDITTGFSEYDNLVNAFLDVSPSDPHGLAVAAFCQRNSIADVTNGGTQTELVSHLGPAGNQSFYLDIGCRQPVSTGATRITW